MKFNADSSLKAHIPNLLRLWRGGGNGSALSAPEAALVSRELLKVQRGLTGSRELAGADYMQDKNLLGAYLLYYWPVSYTQISRCIPYFCGGLKSLLVQKERLPQKELCVLDVGSGPGPASCAVKDFALAENPLLHVSIDLIDSSPLALDAAKKILLGGKDASRVAAKSRVADLEKTDFSFLQKKYDVIVASHALNELWKEADDSLEKKEALLCSLASALSPNGILLLCEPALLQTSRALIMLRNSLVKRGLFLLAPCIASEAECPALLAGENHTCHAELPWSPVEPAATLARLAKLERNSVKMTFFAFLNAPPQKADSPKEQDEAQSYRVVSSPMLNKSGRVRLLLCNGKRRVAFSAKKGDPLAEEAGFFGLARYEKISLLHPEERGSAENPAFGFACGTQILKE